MANSKRFDDRPLVVIYTDGACKGNPDGPGGYGAVVKYLDDDGKVLRIDEFTGAFKFTTNNRMEILGVVVAVESLQQPSCITIISDSKYVVQALSCGWIWNWMKNGWVTSTQTPVKNVDLWQRLLVALRPHRCEFQWVKGHNGHPENERCDFLASASAKGKVFIKGDDGRCILIDEKTQQEEKHDYSFMVLNAAMEVFDYLKDTLDEEKIKEKGGTQKMIDEIAIIIDAKIK
jgi:ribonuclease HI